MGPAKKTWVEAPSKGRLYDDDDGGKFFIQIPYNFLRITQVFFTLFVCATHATSASYRNNQSSSNDLLSLVHTDSASYTKGSKWGLVAEQAMIDTLYLIKGSILIFYYQFT